MSIIHFTNNNMRADYKLEWLKIPSKYGINRRRDLIMDKAGGYLWGTNFESSKTQDMLDISFYVKRKEITLGRASSILMIAQEDIDRFRLWFDQNVARFLAEINKLEDEERNLLKHDPTQSRQA